MSHESRREFLKRLAHGTVYAAPLVITVAAPPGLAGQGKASQHKPPGVSNLQTQQAPGESPYPPPPGRTPPPGTEPPGSPRP